MILYDTDFIAGLCGAVLCSISPIAKTGLYNYYDDHALRVFGKVKRSFHVKNTNGFEIGFHNERSISYSTNYFKGGYTAI